MDFKNLIGRISVCMHGIDGEDKKETKLNFLLNHDDEMAIKEILAKKLLPVALNNKKRRNLISDDDRHPKHHITMTFDAIVGESDEEKP